MLTNYAPTLGHPATSGPVGGGAGSPEGAVIGSPFEWWVDTSSGTLYVKTSGFGTDTGWTAISGGGGGGTQEVFVGAGTPEGTQPADAGRAFYWDTTNKILYIKDQGTGMTGWRDVLSVPEADKASASTTDLGTATTDNVRITGTTTITSFGSTAAEGRRFWIRFAGALTLTHNATSLIIPGGASVTTAANDRALVRHLGSGNWIVLTYQKADGTALVGSTLTASSTDTLTNKRITPRVRQQTDVATLTPNFDTYDVEELTAQAQNLTIAAPTGTPQNFDPRFIVVKTTVAKTLSWNAAYVDGGATLTRPTQTEVGINIYTFRYSTTKAAYVLCAKLEGI